MRILCLLVSAAAIAACASTSQTPVETTSAPACNDLAASARKEVADAIASGATCSTDADCIETSLGASCFDSCARTVSTSGLAAVNAAKSKVDAAQCKQFLDQGCKVLIPPCAPPRPMKCVSGACQM